MLNQAIHHKTMTKERIALEQGQNWNSLTVGCRVILEVEYGGIIMWTHKGWGAMSYRVCTDTEFYDWIDSTDAFLESLK
jgi:hypothetical protein